MHSWTHSSSLRVPSLLILAAAFVSEYFHRVHNSSVLDKGSMEGEPSGECKRSPSNVCTTATPHSRQFFHFPPQKRINFCENLSAKNFEPRPEIKLKERRNNGKLLIEIKTKVIVDVTKNICAILFRTSIISTGKVLKKPKIVYQTQQLKLFPNNEF